MLVNGKFVEDLRGKLGLTQRELAERAGLYQTQISRIERSGEDPISLRQWSKLRDAFFDLRVQGLDLAERSREAGEQVFVRRADDGTVSIVPLGGFPPSEGPRTQEQSPRSADWIPFQCTPMGGATIATLSLKGSLTRAELTALKAWLRKVEAVAEACAEVEP